MAVPKVKVTFDADYEDLKKGVKGATTEVESFGDKVTEFGKKAAVAFAAAAAAAGAYAAKLAVDGVKAAMEDEKSQTQLALALTNVTGATEKQIKAVEDQILQLSLASGVADDKLRPAYSRLLRSTEDTEKAQKLLTLAMDVSTATGKPLEATTNAIAKAFDGNTAALGKLGVGLSATELKTMTFEQVTKKLSDTFGGAAAANADTYAGKMARVQIAFDEAKETLGYKLLPILDKFFDFVNETALPALTAFGDNFSLNGKAMSDVATTVQKTVQPIFNGLKSALTNVKDAIVENKDNFQAFWEVIKFIAPKIGTVLGAGLTVVGEIAKTVIGVFSDVLAAIKPIINAAIDGINKVITGINLIKTGKDIPQIQKIGATPAGFSGTMPNGLPLGAVSTPIAPTPTITASDGSSVASAGSSAASAVASSNVVTGNFNAGSFRMAEAASMATPVVNNITVNGAIDPEGTARTIVDVLNTSAARGTLGGLALVGAFDR